MKRYFSLSILLLVLSSGFQNCSPSSTPSSQAQNSVFTTPAAFSGNGDGYDGKVYVHYLENDLCPDGSRIDSQVRVSEGITNLVRSNCQDLNPSEQTHAPVVFDPNDPSRVVYGGQYFQELYTIYSSLSRSGTNGVYALGTVYRTWEGNVPYVAKVDNKGGTLWSLRLQDPSSPLPINVDVSTNLDDQHLLIAGAYQDLTTLDAQTQPQAAFLTGLGPTDDIEFARRWASATPLSEKLYIRQILPTSSGRIFALVSLGRYFPSNNGLVADAWDAGLVEIDAQGSLLNQHWFKDIDLREMILCADGELLIRGLANGKDQLIKMTGDGVIEWIRESDFLLSKIVIHPEGGAYLLGQQNSGGLSVIAHVNDSGNLIWTVGFKATGETFSLFQAGLSGPSGELIALGLADRSPGRVGVILGVSPSGELLWNVQHALGFAARFKLATLTPTGHLWTSFADVNLVGGQMNDTLRPLQLSSVQLDCAACSSRTDLQARQPSLNLISSSLQPTPRSSPIFTETQALLQTANLNYPIWLSLK